MLFQGGVFSTPTLPPSHPPPTQAHHKHNTHISNMPLLCSSPLIVITISHSAYTHVTRLAARNSRKTRVLCSPTHAFTQPQWWSKRGMHLHRERQQQAGPRGGGGGDADPLATCARACAGVQLNALARGVGLDHLRLAVGVDNGTAAIAIRVRAAACAGHQQIMRYLTGKTSNSA
jgi:hypothetical protein